MPTVTTGTFFLARQRCVETSSSATGEFRLQLRLVDRQGPGRTEPYVVTWSGPAAQQWHAQHQHALVPGRGLQVRLLNPRSMQGLHAPETHAAVESCSLAPLAPSWQPSAASTHPGRAAPAAGF